MRPGATVVIPSIPPRQHQLRQAVASVLHQTLQPTAVIIEVDHDHEGAAVTRHRGLAKVTTEWTAFLDDDDLLDAIHLQTLMDTAEQHGADYVWSQFRLGFADGRTQAGPYPLGTGTFDQWRDEQPAQTTITTMVRTELALKVGGFAGFTDTGQEIDGQRFGEDWDFTLRMREAGAVFRHAPVVTWTWMHWGGNTSGRGDRW